MRKEVTSEIIGLENEAEICSRTEPENEIPFSSIECKRMF